MVPSERIANATLSFKASTLDQLRPLHSFGAVTVACRWREIDTVSVRFRERNHASLTVRLNLVIVIESLALKLHDTKRSVIVDPDVVPQ